MTEFESAAGARFFFDSRTSWRRVVHSSWPVRRLRDFSTSSKPAAWSNIALTSSRVGSEIHFPVSIKFKYGKDFLFQRFFVHFAKNTNFVHQKVFKLIFEKKIKYENWYFKISKIVICLWFNVGILKNESCEIIFWWNKIYSFIL